MHLRLTPRILVGLLLALTACHTRAGEAEQSMRVTHSVVAPPPPCDGCTVDVPATRTGAMPLLVVLHGNHETARAAADRWRAVAVRRGWVVLGLQCPRAKGCDELGRWYLWGGSPAWVATQVHELALSWDLVPGADHHAEDEALDPAKAAHILDWLEDRARLPTVS